MNNRIKGKQFLIILITYLAFISLGLPDGLLGIAWPYMSELFLIPIDSLGILLIGFTAGYLSSSTTSGKILSLISLGLLLSISCFITGLSLLMYAFSGSWYLVIIASFFLGSGGGAIDSSINTFAASSFSPSVVNWLHAFYGIGATSGPLIMTYMLANGMKWNYGYIMVSVIQISLSFLFVLTLKYWKTSVNQDQQETSAPILQSFKLPVIWINILIFFLYTGLEIGIGQWVFTLLTKSRGVSEEQAGLSTSAYWGSLTAGRILFGIILTRIPVYKVLTTSMIGLIAGTILLVSRQSELLTITGIMLIGFCNAPVFPSLISITPERVGKEHAANAIGFQISSAMIGGALIPGFAGLLSDSFGLEIIPKVFSAGATLLLLLFVTGNKLNERKNSI